MRMSEICHNNSDDLIWAWIYANFCCLQTHQLSGYRHSPKPGTLVQGLVPDAGTGMVSPE